MRYACLCILIFTACTGSDGTRGAIQYNCKDFMLIDSAKPSTPCWLIPGETQDFPIYYMGPAADTISIGNRFWNDRNAYSDTMPDLFTKSYSVNDLEITADTSISCFRGIEYWHESDPSITDSTKWYHSFLLILKNKSDSTLYLGRTNSLYYMQLEGQCQDGQWTRIQKPLSEMWLCGTGQPDIFLGPGQIILSKIIRRKDPDFIQYRLAWKGGGGIIYSNVFTM
jgi:hypothetical protein